MRRCAVLVVLVALAWAPPGRAALTETPTCSLPPTADGALCEHGRSPNSIVAGPDGALWFTAYGGGDIGRITPSGSLSLLPVPGPDGHPEGIAAGPDGALWFAEDFGNRIGRLDTAGAFSFVDDPGARPVDVAAGPDGALWISESATNSVGRLDPATGALTHVALPAVAPGKVGVKTGRIVAGPDGRMWVAEPLRGAVAAVTTAGTVSEYKLPAGRSPRELTRGPDGAVWFTSYATDEIGRVTPAGKVKLVSIAGSGPSSITTGPDGALWVGEGRAAGVLRVTPGGAVSETPLFFAPTVNGIAPGPDGAIWFTETGPNRIGRLTLPGTSPAPPPGPPPAPPEPAPASLALNAPVASATQVSVPLRATGAAKLDVVLALQSSGLRARRLSEAQTSIPAGRVTVKVRLDRRARRSLSRAKRRGASLVVALRARGSDRRFTVAQRSRRLR